MAKYLVTGAAGFIGSNLVEGLLECGHQVRGVDNFLTGRRENVEPFLGRFEFIEGDLCDPAVARDAVAGCEYVLHEAALPSVQRSVEDPARTDRVNLGAMVNVLAAAREASVRKVVIAGSSSAYGESAVLPKVETMMPSPLSPYGVTKYASELYGRVFAGLWGLGVVTLRYFNVFGPRQDPRSQYAAVIPIFVTRMLAGRRPVVYGDGRQSRDFTYVSNVVEANLLAASAAVSDGSVVNIACGVRTTLNNLVDMINAELGTDLAPIYEPARSGDVKDSLADVSLAGKLIGYAPRVSLAEGLKRVVEWHRRRK